MSRAPPPLKWVRPKGGKVEQRAENGSGGVTPPPLRTVPPRSSFALDPHASEATDWSRKRRIFEIEEFLLHKVPLLQTMQAFERKRMAPFITVVSYNSGEAVMVEGAEADAMFFVKEGCASAYIAGRGVVRDFEIGSYYGELALLTGHPRAATVTAGSDGAVCYRLGADHFQEVPKYIRLNFMRHAAVAYAKSLHPVDGHDESAAAAAVKLERSLSKTRSKKKLLEYIESTVYKGHILSGSLPRIGKGASIVQVEVDKSDDNVYGSDDDDLETGSDSTDSDTELAEHETVSPRRPSMELAQLPRAPPRGIIMSPASNGAERQATEIRDPTTADMPNRERKVTFGGDSPATQLATAQAIPDRFTEQRAQTAARRQQQDVTTANINVPQRRKLSRGGGCCSSRPVEY